jgi:hypothetical protein
MSDDSEVSDVSIEAAGDAASDLNADDDDDDDDDENCDEADSADPWESKVEEFEKSLSFSPSLLIGKTAVSYTHAR